MTDLDVLDHAQQLADRVEGGKVDTVERVFGGRNNQVYRVQTRARRSFALKRYSNHPADTRDRLGVEFAFSTYAWETGLRCLPQPLASAPEDHMALFGWVDGRLLTDADISEAALSQVQSLLRGLDEGRSSARAKALPLASEACLTVKDHVDTVQRRLEHLEEVLGDDPLSRQAGQLISDIDSSWKKVRSHTERGAETLAYGGAALPREDQCLSPSDLGFHNALMNAAGTITFLDFEYAGWDDPAKLVCDFFYQEKVPVPRTFYETFRDAIIAGHAHPAEEARRIDLLMPVYGIKWLIMRLNEFRPEGAHRRALAAPHEDPEDRKAKQLDKARVAYAQLQAGLADMGIV